MEKANRPQIGDVFKMMGARHVIVDLSYEMAKMRTTIEENDLDNGLWAMALDGEYKGNVLLLGREADFESIARPLGRLDPHVEPSDQTPLVDRFIKRMVNRSHDFYQVTQYNAKKSKQLANELFEAGGCPINQMIYIRDIVESYGLQNPPTHIRIADTLDTQVFFGIDEEEENDSLDLFSFYQALYGDDFSLHSFEKNESEVCTPPAQ